jgi:hypothetical protein
MIEQDFPRIYSARRTTARHNAKDAEMSKRIPVPPELEHLIEKRDREEDRRLAEQRSGQEQRGEDLGPLGAIESAESLDDVPDENRRSGQQRRASKDRRRNKRRDSEE